jgi:phospholipase A1
VSNLWLFVVKNYSLPSRIEYLNHFHRLFTGAVLLLLALGVPHTAYAVDDHSLEQLPGQLRAYKPNYFIFIDDLKGGAWEIKFQFSTKVKIYSLNENTDHGLYFGYTQKSFWDIFETSAPFRSSDYNPEMFYLYPFNLPWLEYVQVGLEHESNGEDGLESRAWNKPYLEFNLTKEFQIPRYNRRHQLSLSPRAWGLIFAKGDNNNNIEDFLSYWQVTAALEDHDKMYRLGVEVREKSMLVDLSGRFSKMRQGFYLHLHYWNGYGERLISYDRHTHRIGLGASFIKW